MEKDNNELFEEVLNQSLVHVKSLDKYQDGEEYQNAVESLSVLYKTKIEKDRAVIDAEDKKHQQIDRRIQLGTTIGLGLLGLGLNTMWILLGFTHEETGSIRSATLKSLINKLRF